MRADTGETRCTSAILAGRTCRVGAVLRVGRPVRAQHAAAR
jgi:hypothetical protein